MSDPESTAFAVITEAISGVPEPVKTSFFKVLVDLLGGLVSIPSAKFKQYAQAIEDTTAARSMAAGVLAKAAAEEASRDPELLKIAAEIYLPTTLRKARNRLSVAQSASEHLATDTIGTNAEGPVSPDDDWMNSFMRFAEDASSERLQDLFGRILAGQVLRPGAFGLATLRAVSELDEGVANDFSWAWAKSVGEAVDYSPEWQRGEGFSRWKRLNEASLMAPTSTYQYLPPFKPLLNDAALWSPISADGVGLLVYFQEGSTSKWSHIDFTRVGRELGRILPKPDYEENMRQAAHRLPRQGVMRMELFRPDKPSELVWEAAS